MVDSETLRKAGEAARKFFAIQGTIIDWTDLECYEWLKSKADEVEIRRTQTLENTNLVSKYFEQLSSESNHSSASAKTETRTKFEKFFGKCKTVDNGDGTYTHTFR